MESIEASIVVWRLFLKAVTVAKVPLALISTRIVHALDTCSTPRSLRPDLVRHLKSCKNEVSFLLLVLASEATIAVVASLRTLSFFSLRKVDWNNLYLGFLVVVQKWRKKKNLISGIFILSSRKNNFLSKPVANSFCAISWISFITSCGSLHV